MKKYKVLDLVGVDLEAIERARLEDVTNRVHAAGGIAPLPAAVSGGGDGDGGRGARVASMSGGVKADIEAGQGGATAVVPGAYPVPTYGAPMQPTYSAVEALLGTTALGGPTHRGSMLGAPPAYNTASVPATSRSASLSSATGNAPGYGAVGPTGGANGTGSSSGRGYSYNPTGSSAPPPPYQLTTVFPLDELRGMGLH